MKRRLGKGLENAHNLVTWLGWINAIMLKTNMIVWSKWKRHYVQEIWFNDQYATINYGNNLKEMKFHDRVIKFESKSEFSEPFLPNLLLCQCAFFLHIRSHFFVFCILDYWTVWIFEGLLLWKLFLIFI